MTRFIYSVATWLTLAIDRQTWEVTWWNYQEVGLREAISTIVEEQACMVDGVLEGRTGWHEFYDL